MPRAGHRHILMLYSYIALLILAGGLAVLPVRVPQLQFLWISDWILWAVAGAGGFAVVLSIFFISLRKLAYVQPCSDHIRLVLPFMRMNISYRRILHASSVEMQHLFPPGNYRGWKNKLLRRLGGQTAIVLEMRGWPMPRQVLSLFLSPFFFPDKSSRLALLVPKWMEFSTEMESFRSTWLDGRHRPEITPQNALLKSLSNTRK